MISNMNDNINENDISVNINDEDDDESGDDDNDDDSMNNSNYYTHTVEAIKTKTGLDIGYKVFWPKRNFCIPPQNESGGITDHEYSINPPSHLPSNGNDVPSAVVNDYVVNVVSPPSKCCESYLNDDHESNGDIDKNNEKYVVLELSTQLPSDCMAPMFHGTQWAGTTIWRSAVVALQYLLYYQTDGMNHSNTANISPSNDLAIRSSDISDIGNSGIKLDPTMTLLELGCGLGVPGMVLHAMTGCHSILTDKDDLLLQLQRNIQLNFCNTESDQNHGNEPQPGQQSSAGRRIEAQALDWSIEGVHELLERCTNDGTSSSTSIDVILACDCIYEPLYGDSWRNLLSVQNELLRIYPQAYVLTACHRRPSDGIDSYIIEANQQPHISRAEKLHIPFAHSSVVELYRIHGKI